MAYQEVLEKSHADTAAHSMARYNKDLEKSQADTATHSKVSYNKDPESGIKSVVRSKANKIKILQKVIQTVL